MVNVSDFVLAELAVNHSLAGFRLAETTPLQYADRVADITDGVVSLWIGWDRGFWNTLIGAAGTKMDDRFLLVDLLRAAGITADVPEAIVDAPAEVLAVLSLLGEHQVTLRRLVQGSTDAEIRARINGAMKRRWALTHRASG